MWKRRTLVRRNTLLSSPLLAVVLKSGSIERYYKILWIDGNDNIEKFFVGKRLQTMEYVLVTL